MAGAGRRLPAHRSRRPARHIIAVSGSHIGSANQPCLRLCELPSGGWGRSPSSSCRAALVTDQGTKLLRDVLTKAVAAGTRACLVDVHGITYLDSGGVGSLVWVYRHVMRHGGQLKIVRPSPSAARVLDITKLTTVFEIFADEPSALDSFRI